MDDDAAFVTQNPALINDSMAQRVNISFCNYIGNVRHSYVGYVHSLGKRGTLYGSVASMGSSDMQATDVYGNPTGSTFSARDLSLIVGYGHTWKWLHYGATLKVIQSNLATGYAANATGIAADMGLAYRSKDSLFGAGLVFKNIGAQVDAYTAAQGTGPLPFEIQAGITNKLRYMPLRFSLQLVQLNRWNLIYTDPNAPIEYDLAGNPIEPKSTLVDNIFRHTVFGGEFLFGRGFRIRGGYNHLRRMELRPEQRAMLTGFSLGFGIRTRRFAFDYGYGSYGTSGPAYAHHFGLTLDLNPPARRVLPAENASSGTN